MRRVLPLLVALLGLSCASKDDHPAAAPPCDPATTDCHQPPLSSGAPGDGSGGADSGQDTADWSGQVYQYRDDYFDQGVVFTGQAKVSADGKTARVSDIYDGTVFELAGVAQKASNWFLVEPQVGSGMLATITPLDTRAKVGNLKVGLAPEQLVDGIYGFSLSGAVRDTSKAQIVLRVIDGKGIALAGVTAHVTAELVAYRAEDSWLDDITTTDDSGMVFLGNVPAVPTLSGVNIVLSGEVNARVEAQVLAGATTVVNAIVATP